VRRLARHGRDLIGDPCLGMFEEEPSKTVLDQLRSPLAKVDRKRIGFTNAIGRYNLIKGANIGIIEQDRRKFRVRPANFFYKTRRVRTPGRSAPMAPLSLCNAGWRPCLSKQKALIARCETGAAFSIWHHCKTHILSRRRSPQALALTIESGIRHRLRVRRNRHYCAVRAG
jgi:hypothetical protein